MAKTTTKTATKTVAKTAKPKKAPTAPAKSKVVAKPKAAKPKTANALTKPKAAKPKAAAPKPAKSAIKQTADAISQLASDILADRIVPTIEQIKAIAASALGHDKSKSLRAKKKK